MKAIGLGILAFVVALTGSWFTGASASQDQDATPAGSPTPLACGAPASNGGWGAATASNVRVQLQEVQAAATPAASPAAVTRTALHVTIENLGTAPLPYSAADFLLLDCAGHWHHAIAHGGQTPAIDHGSLAAGGTLTGWVSFDVPATTRGAVFVYQIEAPGQSGAEVRFPLAQLPRGTLGKLQPPRRGTPAATACTPGSAGNAVGGSAVGGNAVGGNGGNGGNATGGSAQGASGTNGADAIGGSAVGCPATPAS